jgi:hypothetical protein
MQGDLPTSCRLLSGLFMYSHWTTDIQRCARYRRAKQKVALKTGIPTTWRSLKRCWAPPIIWLGNHLVAQSISNPASATRRPARAFAPDTICFITPIFCSSAWLVLCCTGACSTNHWTTQARHRGRRKIQSSSHIVPIPEPGSSRLSGPGGLSRSEQYIAQLTELSAATP